MVIFNSYVCLPEGTYTNFSAMDVPYVLVKLGWIEDRPPNGPTAIEQYSWETGSATCPILTSLSESCWNMLELIPQLGGWF